MVSRMTDEDIWRLNRGGHDPHKIYAAFSAATKVVGRPTVILAKTVKGYGMGKVGEGKNPTHQLKKLDTSAIREFRDRFAIPVPDDKLEEVPYYKPADNSPEMKYLHERRQALGGYLPQRRRKADEKIATPGLDAFQAVLEPTAEGREISTTQAFVRSLTQLVRDKSVGPRVVPIIPDEARTFGMEGMFRQLGIYAQAGQLYEPVDKDQVMYYREDKAGQILEEGINEAGAMSSWIAAATSYSHTNRISIPFYIFYSMFGFQRVGDLAWAAGDCQARGFLLGATAGRTTLNGEGLQHQDGHSHLMSATIPNCVSYDPTFAHEVAVILHAGMKRMIENQENVWYYVTLMNENYPQPGMRKGQEEGILKGMYLLREGPAGSGMGKSIPRVQLLGSGTILREAIAAADMLEKDWGVAGDVWSTTSFTELRREGIEIERWNLLHPAEKPRKAYITQQLEKTVGPIVATTDYMRLFADQVRPYIPRGRDYRVLGTDGFGRSDTREKLREYFEVDRRYVVLSALRALADEGAVPASKVGEAIKKYGIDPNKPNPRTA
jgi:pyruvate dehydrogenase E1 component